MLASTLQVNKQPGSTSYSDEFWAGKLVLPANLFAHEQPFEDEHNAARLKGVREESLLFWLSRLQLPGHAFGLALAWPGQPFAAFGCHR